MPIFTAAPHSRFPVAMLLVLGVAGCARKELTTGSVSRQPPRRADVEQRACFGGGTSSVMPIRATRPTRPSRCVTPACCR